MGKGAREAENLRRATEFNYISQKAESPGRQIGLKSSETENRKAPRGGANASEVTFDILKFHDHLW